ncbi:putative ABC transporter ATP-binding protein YbhF [mine drainage metagenome]|uniref:Putative ABC transporter ATP-binding protein YbhF n=1 Tax=mine drainage metagenome TaxID=410659 RepID=A0A1J5P652_9ZZZZ
MLADGEPPRADGERWEAVAPRFEDAFVSRLRDAGRAVAVPPAESAPAAAAPPGAAVIEVHGLRRRFGDFEAVRGIDFEVARGEVFGLLGANGAGKSTVFRMLCGLLAASAGSLRVAGVDLRVARAAARARIGYVAQRFALYANLTVAQNLAFFASAYGLRGARRQRQLDWALHAFELAEVADAGAGELAVGYKQRLALACALMHEPAILFLDEPTSGVDPLARREFWQRINALAESGVTVLVTTHFMDEAEYCDRVVLMSLGEVLASGTPSEIRARARAEGAAEPSLEDAFIALIRQHEAVLRRAA